MLSGPVALLALTLSKALKVVHTLITYWSGSSSLTSNTLWLLFNRGKWSPSINISDMWSRRPCKENSITIDGADMMLSSRKVHECSQIALRLVYFLEPTKQYLESYVRHWVDMTSTSVVNSKHVLCFKKIKLPTHKLPSSGCVFIISPHFEFTRLGNSVYETPQVLS